MLANGITLGLDTTNAGNSFENLKGLKEVPELGIDPEKVENTTLSDTVKQYEMGIGDAGELEYKFAFDNTKADSSYRKLKALETSKAAATFQQSYPDGTKVKFKGQVALKVGGGGVNSVIEFTVKIALQSDLTFTDPIGG